MKAKAPEKIYIHPDIGDREFLRPWLHRPANNESVEYIRTDVFIEKACTWFRTLDDKEPPYTTTEEFINGFKKAMKLWTE